LPVIQFGVCELIWSAVDLDPQLAGFDFSGFHYESCNEADKNDFEKAIETIAVAFSSK